LASQGTEEVNESEPLTLLPNGLPQPPIPQRLMERLRGYPDHIRHLQEELNHKFEGSRAAKGTTSHIFEQVIWTLEGCLDAFIREAKAELGVAEKSGDPNDVAGANAKLQVMLRARSSNGGMKGLDELWQYLERHRDELR
jgi:hypothetical protein